MTRRRDAFVPSSDLGRPHRAHQNMGRGLVGPFEERPVIAPSLRLLKIFQFILAHMTKDVKRAGWPELTGRNL